MSDRTSEAARQWLARAAIDWSSVEIPAGHEQCPRAAVCFHCQQNVEKLLKALLTLLAIEAPRTHDLRRLVQLAAAKCPQWLALSDRGDLLTDHAVQSRYPDEWREIELAEMNEMIPLAEEFAAVLITKLGEG